MIEMCLKMEAKERKSLPNIGSDEIYPFLRNHFLAENQPHFEALNLRFELNGATNVR